MSVFEVAEIAQMRAEALEGATTTCAIQANSPTSTTYGSQTPDWNDVDGMEAIPCRLFPVNRSTELRRPDGTVATVSHGITLDTVYDAITTEHRAVVGGQAFDILAVDHGPDRIVTILRVEQVSV